MLFTDGRSSPQSRTIVITGASAGVGRAAARAFARPGVQLALATHRGICAGAGLAAAAGTAAVLARGR